MWIENDESIDLPLYFASRRKTNHSHLLLLFGTLGRGAAMVQNNLDSIID